MPAGEHNTDRQDRLSEQVEIRMQDYRAVSTESGSDDPFDAIASIEMGEHVGQDNYPVYAATLHTLLRPQGGLLVQQMSRGASSHNSAPGGSTWQERLWHSRRTGWACTRSSWSVPGVHRGSRRRRGRAGRAARRDRRRVGRRVRRRLPLGVWRYTRHPNCFDDAAVWWGPTVLALHHYAGLIGLLGTALMTWLLVKGTGKKLPRKPPPAARGASGSPSCSNSWLCESSAGCGEF